MMKTLLFLILVFFLSTHGYACSIDTSPVPLCKIYPKLDVLIASGKIIKKIDHGYLIRLHTVYKGDETRSVIKIFEQEGWDCNGIDISYPRETLGKLGQVILFVTASTTYINNPEPWYEPRAYYNLYVQLGGYGHFMKPLLKEGDTFNGLFSEGVETISEDEITRGLSACGVSDLLAEPRIISEGLFPKIYPNPAKDQVFIDNLDESYQEILLYDMRGKIVYRSDSFDMNEVISTQEYSSGLYFIVLRSSCATIRKKLVFID